MRLLETSASLHNSQAAIPLAQMTSKWVVSLYDLMDASYDAPQIRFEDMISEMVAHGLEEVKRDLLCRDSGYRITNKVE